MSNERPDLCARCGGACCWTRPGVESPDRFLAAPDPAAAMARLLASGEWVLARQFGVAWQEGEPPPDRDRWRPILVPRPATVAEREARAVQSGATASPCVYLGDAGCRLPFAGRPRMCRELEPWANGECRSDWDLPQAAWDWAPWQALLDDAVRRIPLT